MKSKKALVTLIPMALICVLLLLGARYLTSVKLDANLLNMLPTQTTEKHIERIHELLTKDELQSVVYVLRGETLEQIKEQYQTVKNFLFISSLITEEKVNIDNLSEIRALYRNYNYHFLADNDRELLQKGQFEHFTQRTIKSLYSPTSQLSSETLSRDPFQLTDFFLSQRMQNSALFEGHILTDSSGTYSLLVRAKLNFDIFESKESAEFLALHVDFLAQNSMPYEVLYTGAIFYSKAAENGARTEVVIFGGLSLLLILALMGYIFRTLKSVVVVFSTLLLAGMTGLIVSSLIFNKINIIALAFATSLIGICIDYCAHYLVEEQYNARTAKTESINRIQIALGMSFITTALAYSLMLLSPFPALNQVSVFVVSGLLISLLAVKYLFPMIKFKKVSSELNPFHRCFMQSRAGNKQWHKKISLWVVILFLLFLALLQTVSKKEDLRAMYYRATELVAMQVEVARFTDIPDVNSLLYVTADSEERVLQKLEELEYQLRELQREQPNFKWINIAHWISSEQRQLENFQLVSELYKSQQLLLFERIGLEVKFSPIASMQGLETLSLSDLKGLLPRNISRLVFEYDNQFFGVVMLFNVAPEMNISSLTKDHENVNFVDYLALLEKSINSVKLGLLLTLVGAMLSTAFILIWRYKSLHVLPALLNSLLAINTVLLWLIVSNGYLTIFHVFALFLVLGLSLDFVFIFVSGKGRMQDSALSCSVGALTSVFAFGMLGFSDTPAISMFGQSVALGISVGWLAALIYSTKIQRFELINEK